MKPDQYLDYLFKNPSNPSYDCSEIVDDFEKRFKGQRLRIENQVALADIAIVECSEKVMYQYHEVFLLDDKAYDPRFAAKPIPINEYKSDLISLNALLNVKLKFIIL